MSKKVLTTGKFEFNTIIYGVTSMELGKIIGEVEVTDTKTAGNEKEYLGGRQERPFTIEMFKDVNAADPEIGAVHDGIIDFEGFSYEGDIILLSIKNNAEIDNAVKQTIEGRMTGAIVETPETP